MPECPRLAGALCPDATAVCCLDGIPALVALVADDAVTVDLFNPNTFIGAEPFPPLADAHEFPDIGFNGLPTAHEPPTNNPFVQDRCQVVHPEPTDPRPCPVNGTPCGVCDRECAITMDAEPTVEEPPVYVKTVCPYNNEPCDCNPTTARLCLPSEPDTNEPDTDDEPSTTVTLDLTILSTVDLFDELISRLCKTGDVNDPYVADVVNAAQDLYSHLHDTGL